MTKVTKDTVDHVASLARLSLTEDERTTFARQLDEILAFAESIQKLDTGDVPAMSHAGTAERFREDSPGGGLSHERAIAGAPDASDRLFRVPKVIGS